jgi:hypothetical protein
MKDLDLLPKEHFYAELGKEQRVLPGVGESRAEPEPA